MGTIGQNLKRMRAAAGMTQQGLATAAALSVSVVSQIEQGTNRDPRMTTLVALAGALGVSVDVLVSGGSAATNESVEMPGEVQPAPRNRRGRRGHG